MSQHLMTHRTWRAARGTRIAAILAMIAAGFALGTLAFITVQGVAEPVIVGVLGVLAIVHMVYLWRFVLHPKIKLTSQLRICNPLRTHVLELADIKAIEPGPDGLKIESGDATVEAWCVQKSNGAIRQGKTTRADHIADELLAERDRRRTESAHASATTSADRPQAELVIPASAMPSPPVDNSLSSESAPTDPGPAVLASGDQATGSDEVSATELATVPPSTHQPTDQLTTRSVWARTPSQAQSYVSAEPTHQWQPDPEQNSPAQPTTELAGLVDDAWLASYPGTSAERSDSTDSYAITDSHEGTENYEGTGSYESSDWSDRLGRSARPAWLENTDWSEKNGSEPDWSAHLSARLSSPAEVSLDGAADDTIIRPLSPSLHPSETDSANLAPLLPVASDQSPTWPTPPDPPAAHEVGRRAAEFTDIDPDLIIRRAFRDEADVLVKLEQQINHTALTPIFGSVPFPGVELLQRWPETLADRRVKVRIAEIGGRPIGFVTFDDTEIKRLGVLADHTRRGYGTALLNYALRELARGGQTSPTASVLEADYPARAFFAARGWRVTGERNISDRPPYAVKITMELERPE